MFEQNERRRYIWSFPKQKIIIQKRKPLKIYYTKNITVIIAWQ